LECGRKGAVDGRVMRREVRYSEEERMAV